MEKIKTFVLYQGFAEMIAFLTMEQRGALLTAIFEYAKEERWEVALDLPTQIVFASIRQHMDLDREKYMEKCRINSENGKKGGRPRKATGFSGFEEEPKKAYNENENENNNNNYNYNYNGGENDNNDNPAPASFACEAGDLAPRGMVPFPSETVPPPPPLTKEERRELLRAGVPIGYAKDRLERAAWFSHSMQKSRVAVLCEWWQTDKQKPPSTRREKSYDVDDFFQAALVASYDTT